MTAFITTTMRTPKRKKNRFFILIKLFNNVFKKIKERKGQKKEKEKSPFEKRKNAIGIPTIRVNEKTSDGAERFYSLQPVKGFFNQTFAPSSDFSNILSIANDKILSSMI